MKTFSLIIFCIFCYISLFSQTYTVSGFISDSETGEKLMGSHILQKDTTIGTVSNAYGFYSFSTRQKLLTLEFSYMGYQTQTLSIQLKHDTIVHIALFPGKELNEILVLENKMEAELRSPQTSLVELPVKQLKKLPVLMGETDVLRTLQLLPGVHTGGEGTTALYVRGGGPDQNQILLDGIQIYNAYHLFGFFSVFNPDAIQNIQLYKGGFPAKYGGRISSILDIRMKEGNTNQIKGNATVGLIASSFLLEVPIKGKNTTFVISGRRTYIDWLARPFIKSWADGAIAGFYFYDITGKINHKFSDKSRLYLSTYIGKDNFYSQKEKTSYNINKISEISQQNNLGWANYTAALRWNYIFNEKLFSNTSVTFCKYQYQTGRTFKSQETQNNLTEISEFEYDYNSGIQDEGIKTSFEFLPNPKYTLNFGGEYVYHTFNPGVSIQTTNSNNPENIPIDSTYGNPNINAQEMDLYLENKFHLGTRLQFNLGLRFSGFLVQEKFYKNIEPRIALNILCSDKISLKASAVAMTQYIHLLTNTTSSMPTDLWLPVTKQVQPQKSWQYAVGSVYNLNSELSLSLEGYYKTLENLIEYKEGASFLDGFKEWESMIENGKGWSYGIEVLLKKEIGKTTGWIGYTWSKTERQFENINFGRAFPYKYDRRHDFSIAITHQINPTIDINASWVYGTGNAFTLAHSKIPTLLAEIKGDGYLTPSYQFEERNAYRMPANHRLDLGINFHKQKKHWERIWSLGIYNVYNRKNAYYLEYNSNLNQLVAVSIFPILPYFRYQIKF